MRGAPNKEMRIVIKEAERLGWEIVRWNKHAQLRHPDFPEGPPLTVPGSPTDPTWVRKRMIKRLHKYDYKTMPKKKER